MHCTVQLHSTSGSFGAPWGTDVKQAATLAEAADLLRDWAEEHDKVGSARDDAHALLWFGRYDDVTDLRPDRELSFGPRGGIRSTPC